MSLKLFAIAKNGKMLKVGESTGTSDTAPWYNMTDAVIQFVPGKFTVNDIVEIETTVQAGSKYITKISKTGVTQSAPPVVKETKVSTGATNNGKEVEVTTQKEGYLPKEEWIAKMKAEGKWKEGSDKTDKGTDVNSSIKRQAIGHMTSRTLIGMQGIVTPDNVESLIELIYNKYVQVVG